MAKYNFLYGLHQLIKSGQYELSSSFDIVPCLDGSKLSNCEPIYASTVAYWIKLINKAEKEGVYPDYLPQWKYIYSLLGDMYCREWHLEGLRVEKEDKTCFFVDPTTYSLHRLLTGENVYPANSSTEEAQRYIQTFFSSNAIDFIKSLDVHERALFEILLQTPLISEISKAYLDYRDEFCSYLQDFRNTRVNNDMKNLTKVSKLGLLSIHQLQARNKIHDSIYEILEKHLPFFSKEILSVNIDISARLRDFEFSRFNFSKGLLRCMKQRNMSVTDLSKALNIKESTVRSWTKENGSIPNLDTIEKLCDYFECNIDYLFAIIQYRHPLVYAIKEFMNFTNIETADVFRESNRFILLTLGDVIEYFPDEFMRILNNLMCLYILELRDDFCTKYDAKWDLNFEVTEFEQVLFDYLEKNNIVFDNLLYRFGDYDFSFGTYEIYNIEPPEICDYQTLILYKYYLMTKSIPLNDEDDDDDKIINLFSFLDENCIDILTKDIIKSIKKSMYPIIEFYMDFSPLLWDSDILKITPSGELDSDDSCSSDITSDDLPF